MNAYEQAIEQTVQELESLREDKRIAEMELESLQYDVDAKQETIYQLQRELQTSNRKIDALDLDYRTVLKDCSKLRQVNAELVYAIEKLNEALKVYVA